MNQLYFDQDIPLRPGGTAAQQITELYCNFFLIEVTVQYVKLVAIALHSNNCVGYH